MPHSIKKDDCVGCGACEPVCSSGAIVQDEDKYKIDTAKCNDCHECVSVCPVECILGEKKE